MIAEILLNMARNTIILLLKLLYAEYAYSNNKGMDVFETS
jgi:hypothetical protein